MIAVGIDVSKSKSTVAILNSDGTPLARPFNMAHTLPEMNSFIERLRAFDAPVTILMEYTGHYHYPVLKKLQAEGFPVCLINPYQMKKYGDVEIHKAKTDRKDAVRIATYALENLSTVSGTAEFNDEIVELERVQVGNIRRRTIKDPKTDIGRHILI